MEAGNDLAELRPLSLDPQARVRGNHKGPAYALNVVNPIAGMHYVYVRRDEGDIQRFENEGWELERRDNAQGAKMGRETDAQWGRTMDGTIGRRDIVRMRIDDDGYRAYMTRKQEHISAQSAENVVREFIEKGEPLNERFGGGGPLHYRTAQHREHRVAGVGVNEEE
jgi:hypothetical protein